MPLLETKGAGSAQGFGLTVGGSEEPVYIEDVFSTYLYTGNGSTQTITNGIDLDGKGGLVWAKKRNDTSNHYLADTSRGRGVYISSNTTTANTSVSGTEDITDFLSTGFSLGSSSGSSSPNSSGGQMVSWTFRKQPKFFDVQTFTTTGTGGTQILSHDLGAVPAFILLKKTSGTGNWWAIHRSVTQYSANWWENTGVLEGTGAFFQGDLLTSEPTTTQIALGPTFTNSGNEGTYVAYLFAHNAGGFGLTGTDNVISCGSFTTDSSGNFTTSLGYEPQWILFKNSGASSNWNLIDTMRGWPVGAGSSYLRPNTSGAETTDSTPYMIPTATGFAGINGGFGNTQTYIYIAIRRGPMKVPTSGTSVFAPVAQNASANAVVTTNFPVDLSISAQRSKVANEGTNVFDRLRGTSTTRGSMLQTNRDTSEYVWTSNGMGLANNTALIDNFYTLFGITSSVAYWNFRRAPGFFDVVCWAGTTSEGTPITVSHNLAVAPELIITKKRSQGAGWFTYHAALTAGNYVTLNASSASAAYSNMWNNTAPTSTVFTTAYQNESGDTYVAYLFATCAGVSKVGSYTGTGTTLQIDCGFTGGARFVMIKRTDSTGDWYVWDSARGIIAGNDPYLLLNSTAAEVTNTDYVDTYSAGFEISSTAPAAINASGGSFIFLAIA
jgi:hypothetical protein